jgi:hypothetical protein
MEFSAFCDHHARRDEVYRIGALKSAGRRTFGAEHRKRYRAQHLHTPNFDTRLPIVRSGIILPGPALPAAPGNALLLTSKVTAAFGGDTYTGLHGWSFSTEFSGNFSQSLGNVIGDYRDFGGALRTSHQISQAFYTFAVQRAPLQQREFRRLQSSDLGCAHRRRIFAW